MSDFYKKFQKDLKYAEKHMENIKRMEKPTDEKCEKCGVPPAFQVGQEHGSFYAAAPDDKEDPNTCTFTKENPINLPDLDSADMQKTGSRRRILRELRPRDGLERGRFGQFMADPATPTATCRLYQGKKVPDIPLDELCPKRGRNMMIRHGQPGESPPAADIPST